MLDTKSDESTAKISEQIKCDFKSHESLSLFLKYLFKINTHSNFNNTSKKFYFLNKNYFLL